MAYLHAVFQCGGVILTWFLAAQSMPFSIVTFFGGALPLSLSLPPSFSFPLSLSLPLLPPWRHRKIQLLSHATLVSQEAKGTAPDTSVAKICGFGVRGVLGLWTFSCSCKRSPLALGLLPPPLILTPGGGDNAHWQIGT